MSRVLHSLSGNGRRNLICFPHAGGSVASFRGWDRLWLDTNVWVAKYPGRGDRIAERFASSLQALGQEAAHAIHDHTIGAFALFGHSLGAPVALEAARELDRLGRPADLLIVSGSRAGNPPTTRKPSVSTEQSDATLIEHLREMGGVDEDLLDNPEFREVVLPYIRSDGALFRIYRAEGGTPVSCPIVSISGDLDTHACLFPWPELTRSTYQAHVVPGGHFYHLANPPAALVARAIAEHSTREII